MEFQTHNPSTGELITTYRHLTPEQANSRIELSWQTYAKWREVPVLDRAKAVAAWAQSLRDKKYQMARSMTREMGKPITQALAEIEKSAAALDYIAEHGPGWIATKPVELASGQGEIGFEPLGPVLAIMPWNYPLWQVIRFAGPALLAGNTILMKHADLTAGTGLLIAGSAQNIAPGFDLLQDFSVDHETAALAMAHAKIRGVTFTGSTEGGRKVAETAAKNLKKSVLELGGSDPYLVLADADLEKSAEICAAARLVNAGQSCVAGKRFIVEKVIADAWLKVFVAKMNQDQPADPNLSETKLGPLAAKHFQTLVVQQVATLKEMGGRVLLGGTAPAGPGAFFPPTVIHFSNPVAGLGNLEIFGPVAIVIVVDSVDEAVKVANDSIYGLGAAVFTKDLSLATDVARRLEAGYVGINEQVISNVRLPFGGVKSSGWGRELSPHGILEFCNIQTRAGARLR